MTALMTYNAGDEHMMPKYINECKKLKLSLKSPEINKSTENFRIIENKKGRIWPSE